MKSDSDSGATLSGSGSAGSAPSPSVSALRAPIPGADVTPRQLYEAIDADFAEDPMRRAWERLDKHTKQLWRGYAIVVNAWTHTRARDQVRSTETEGLGPKGDEPGPQDAP